MTQPTDAEHRRPLAAEVSLVVPVHTGRAPYVIDMLRRVAEHSADEHTEIILVDSSTDGEARLLESLCEELVGARYLRGPVSAAEKRNIGAYAASSDLMLFVDSDCLIPPGTIRSHVEFMRRAPDEVAAAIGPTRMIGADDTYPWTVARHSHKYNQCYDWPERYERVLWGTTSNIIIRKDDFLRVGGFRTMFPAPVGGEDVDFGVRLTDAGRVVATNRCAEVGHRREHITRLRQVMRSLYFYGIADAALADAHPDRTSAHRPTQLLGFLTASGVALAWRRRDASLALILTALAGCAAVIARHQGEMYTTDARRRIPLGPRESARILAAHGLDAAFGVGNLVGAVRRGRPWLATKRFRYVNDREFLRAPQPGRRPEPALSTPSSAGIG